MNMIHNYALKITQQSKAIGTGIWMNLKNYYLDGKKPNTQTKHTDKTHRHKKLYLNYRILFTES